MGAPVPPHRAAVPEADIVFHTDCGAFATAHAGAGGVEGAGLDDKAVKEGVHRSGFELVDRSAPDGREGLAPADALRPLLQPRHRGCHDSAGLLRPGSAEQGDVVLRHDNRQNAAVGEAHVPAKGLQPGDQAAPLLRPLLAAYDEQRVAHLLRDSLRVQPEDYEAMNVCLRAQAQAAAEALLERGMKLDGYLAWAAKQDVLLDTQAQEILDRLAEQQAQVNSAPEQNGPVLGGMSL